MLSRPGWRKSSTKFAKLVTSRTKSGFPAFRQVAHVSHSQKSKKQTGPLKT